MNFGNLGQFKDRIKASADAVRSFKGFDDMAAKDDYIHSEDLNVGSGSGRGSGSTRQKQQRQGDRYDDDDSSSHQDNMTSTRSIGSNRSNNSSRSKSNINRKPQLPKTPTSDGGPAVQKDHSSGRDGIFYDSSSRSLSMPVTAQEEAVPAATPISPFDNRYQQNKQRHASKASSATQATAVIPLLSVVSDALKDKPEEDRPSSSNDVSEIRNDGDRPRQKGQRQQQQQQHQRRQNSNQSSSLMGHGSQPEDDDNSDDEDDDPIMALLRKDSKPNEGAGSKNGLIRGHAPGGITALPTATTAYNKDDNNDAALVDSSSERSGYSRKKNANRFMEDLDELIARPIESTTQIPTPPPPNDADESLGAESERSKASMNPTTWLRSLASSIKTGSAAKFGTTANETSNGTTTTELAPLSRKRLYPKANNQQQTGQNDDEENVHVVVSSSILAGDELRQLQELRAGGYRTGMCCKLYSLVRDNPREAFIVLTLILCIFAYFYSHTLSPDTR